MEWLTLLPPDGPITGLVMVLLAGLLVGHLGRLVVSAGAVGLPTLLGALGLVSHPRACGRRPAADARDHIVAAGPRGADVKMRSSMSAGSEERAAAWSYRPWLAQRRYGFDRPTAVRLAFIQWLYETGRLSDWCGFEPRGDVRRHILWSARARGGRSNAASDVVSQADRA
jgi:hypothetical protein